MTDVRNKGFSLMLQTFACFSGILLNVGAYVQTASDLKEEGLYTDRLKQLNNTFIVLEIFQVILFFVFVFAVCKDYRYLKVALIWLEDAILEVPMILIAYYLTSHLDSIISLVLVVAGGFLGIMVAIGDTVLEF